MADYGQWTERLKNFLVKVASLPGDTEVKSDIAEPIAASEIAKLNRSLRIKMPSEIQQFLLHQSANCTYSYHWSPDGSKALLRSELFPSDKCIFGALKLCNCGAFERNQHLCFDWVEDSRDSDQKNLWRESFPFAELGNGDYLAIDLNSPSHSVVYLNHDFVDGGGTNPIIADTFDELLMEIERHYYLQVWFWFDVFATDASMVKQAIDNRKLSQLFSV